jgi:DNA-3-methyladenine glycosylase
MDGEVIIKPPERIERSGVPVDTVTLARYLLGKVLVHELDDATVTGRIVETEAYLPGDPACHAFRGMTTRNKSLFLEHGRAYVYLCYGTSYLLNMSSEAPGIGAGVLLRAVQPLHGIDHMRRMSSRDRLRDLARGPGRLTTAFRVDRRHDGLDLYSDRRLWIGSDGHPADDIAHSVRIGISKGADARLRYFIAGNPFVSGPRGLNMATDSNAA